MNNKSVYFPLALILALTMTGCGGDGMVRVTGKVAFDDNTPVTRGSIYFSSGTHAASGTIQPNGTYTLDAKPGEYIVIVEKNWDDSHDEDGNIIVTDPFEVDSKYTSRETTDLKYTVEAGKRNVYDIVVERKK